MRTIAEANNALSMSGVEFMGRPIRVGRPADYTPPTPEMILQCEGTGILGTPGAWRGGAVWWWARQQARKSGKRRWRWRRRCAPPRNDRGARSG